MHLRSFVVPILLTALLASLALSSCSRGQSDSEVEVPLADLEAMPAEVQDSPRRVAVAYRFAAANPDVTQQIPCYCGCGPMGHDSNYACFWQDDGSLETHAMGCGICVDIAQDTLRGLRQGRSLQDIRTQIDADYSRFGPPTHTPPIGVQSIDWSAPSPANGEMTCENPSWASTQLPQTVASSCSSP